MKWTVLGIFIFVLAIEKAAAEDFENGFVKRIIGGEESEANQWPWLANILKWDEETKTYKHRCGGVLIDANWVLTAAHCLLFSPNAKYKVRLGEHDQNVDSKIERDYRVVYYHQHDRFFADEEYAYDIALVKIAPKARFSKYVKRIDLPRLFEQVPVGSKCFVTGWGKTGPDSRQTVLRHVELPIVSYKTCAAANDKLPYSNVSLFSNICAGDATNKSGCHGDSGGPLMCKNAHGKFVLQGIVSWGDQYCSSNFYSVFTRVSSFINWIRYMKSTPRQHIGKDCKKDYHYFCKEWKNKGWCIYTFIQTYCQKTCVGCDVEV